MLAIADGTALGTNQTGPARWIATFVRRPLKPDRTRMFADLEGLTTTVHGKKLDGEMHLTQRFDLVLDARGYALGLAAPQFHVDRWDGGRHKPQLALVHNDPSPGASCDPVGSAQTGRDGLSRYGLSRYGLSRYGLSRYGLSRYGLSRYGLSRYGLSRYGLSRYGLSRYGLSRYGLSRYGLSRYGL